MMLANLPAPLAPRLALWALALPLLGLGCGRASQPAASASPDSAAVAVATPAPEGTPEPAPEATPLPPGIARLVEPFKGDLDGMIERRVIRVLTVQNPILYFVDRGREVGITYEAIKAFEKQLNDKLGNKVVKVHVVALPVARDQLIPMLVAGQGRPRRRAAHRHPGAEEAGGLLLSRRDRRPRGPRHRKGRPAGGEPGRALGPGGVRPALEQLRRARRRPQQALRGRGPAAPEDHPRPGGARGRGHPRDGERRARPGHGGGRHHRRPLHAGLPEPAQALRHREPSRRHRLGLPQEQPEAGGRGERLRQGPRAGDAGRATCSSTST